MALRQSNAAYLASNAFMALVTLVAEQNQAMFDGNAVQTVGDGVSHESYLSRVSLMLLHAATEWDKNLIYSYDAGGQPFQESEALVLTSQALDYYYAIENAYAHYGLSTGPLPLYPDFQEKAQTRDRIIREHQHAIDALYERTVERVVAGRSESGNIKVSGMASIGYVLLGYKSYDNGDETFGYDCTQQGFGSFCGLGFPYGDGIDLYELFNSSMWVAKPQLNLTDRDAVWGFQTGSQGKYWAEGPYYFEITLPHVLRLWHAARANRILRPPYGAQSSWGDFYGPAHLFGGDDNGPFYSPQFINPIRAHADLVRPDGSTLALDDGNQFPMFSSTTLRWAPEYGAADVGRKFDFITRSRLGSGGYVNFTATPEPFINIAIPLTDSPLPPPDNIRNSGGIGNDMQVLSRFAPDGTSCNVPLKEREGNLGSGCHFLVLNGERGMAITSGEGHEQADQLQLLWTIDGDQILIDSGYNSGFSWRPPGFNSTWNHYHDHNVMRMYPPGQVYPNLVNPVGGGEPYNPSVWTSNDGGLPGPYIDADDAQKKSRHSEVTDLASADSENGLVTVLAGSIKTLHEPGLLGVKELGTWTRRVLFIKDQDAPYLIDYSAAIFEGESRVGGMVMSYHIDQDPSPAAPNQGQHTARQTFTNLRGSGRYDLAVEMTRIETPWMYSKDFAFRTAPDMAEYDSDPVPITRLDAWGYNNSIETISGPNNTEPYDETRTHSVVSFFSPYTGAEPSPHRRLIGVESYNQADAYDQRYNAWIRTTAPDRIDVFIARAAADVYRDYTSRPLISFTVPEAGGETVTLSQVYNYGFVRLAYTNGAWSKDRGSAINVSIPALPLTASIDGPSSVPYYGTHTWTAQTSEGQGAGPTYQWEYANASGYCDSGPGSLSSGSPSSSNKSNPPKQEKKSKSGEDGPTTEALPCEEWYVVGTAPTYSRQATDASFRLRLTVQRGTETVVVTKYVYTSGGSNATVAPAEGPTVASQLRGAESPETFALYPATPNPARDMTVVGYDLPEAMRVGLVVYDALGRVVREQPAVEREAGRYRAEIETAGLASGVYVILLDAGSVRATQRVTVLR